MKRLAQLRKSDALRDEDFSVFDRLGELPPELPCAYSAGWQKRGSLEVVAQNS